MGHSRRLLALESVDAACAVRARCNAGIRTVAIEQIRGSEGRAHDFDRDFNPLQEHTKGRWLSIAAARQRGKALPPVVLVQVGDLYFVRDGHHRISVARALGQLDIEAKVTVWQVDGSLPWDVSTIGQPRGVKRGFGKLRREGARLQERALLGVHDLLGAVRVMLRGPVVPRPDAHRP
jgi:hypothetical protein